MASRAPALTGALERAAGVLLDLVDEKGEQHQPGEHAGKILFAVAIVVLEVIALVFERVNPIVS